MYICKNIYLYIMYIYEIYMNHLYLQINDISSSLLACTLSLCVITHTGTIAISISSFIVLIIFKVLKGRYNKVRVISQ